MEKNEGRKKRKGVLSSLLFVFMGITVLFNKVGVYLKKQIYYLGEGKANMEISEEETENEIILSENDEIEEFSSVIEEIEENAITKEKTKVVKEYDVSIISNKNNETTAKKTTEQNPDVVVEVAKEKETEVATLEEKEEEISTQSETEEGEVLGARRERTVETTPEEKTETTEESEKSEESGISAQSELGEETESIEEVNSNDEVATWIKSELDTEKTIIKDYFSKHKNEEVSLDSTGTNTGVVVNQVLVEQKIIPADGECSWKIIRKNGDI